MKPKIFFHIKDTTLLFLLQQQVQALRWIEAEDGCVISDMDPKAPVFLTPPIRLGEVLDRVERTHSQHMARPSQPVNLGRRVMLDAQAMCLHMPGEKPLPLTDTEVDILLALYRNSDGILERATLMTDILGYHEDVESHSVETHIYRLRQKLDTRPGLSDLIVTEKGGYSLWTMMQT